MARITSASGKSPVRFVRESIDPESVVHTDGWESYGASLDKGYGHDVSILKGKPAEAASELLPRVHRVVSLLGRWRIACRLWGGMLQQISRLNALLWRASQAARTVRELITDLVSRGIREGIECSNTKIFSPVTRYARPYFAIVFRIINTSKTKLAITC